MSWYKKLCLVFEKKGSHFLWLAVLAYILLLSFLCFWKYFSFQYSEIDLAIFSQSLWNTLHGKFFFSSIQGLSYFGDHFSPLLFFLIPFYALFSHPLALLFLQTLVLGLSAWPLYLIAKLYLSKRVALFVSLAYLIFPYLGQVNLYEFHTLGFSLFFLLWMFYFFEKRRFLFFLIFLILTLFCREDLAFIVLIFSFYALIKKRSLKWILTPCFLAFLWLFASIKIVSFFNQSDYGYYKFLHLYDLGKSFKEILQNLISHPETIVIRLLRINNLVYLLALFAPLALIPLFHLPSLLFILPSFFQLGFTSSAALGTLFYHYTAPLIPFLFISFILGLKKLKIKFKKAKNIDKIFLFSLVTFTLLVSNIGLNPVIRLPFRLSKITKKEEIQIKENFIKSVPNKASVVASVDFLVNLAHRPELYSLHYVILNKKQYIDTPYLLPNHTQYALINFSDTMNFLLNLDIFRFKNFQGGQNQGSQNLRKALEKFEIVKILDDLVLLKKGQKSDFKLFEIVQNPKIENHLDIDLDQEIRFLGYDGNLEILTYRINKNYYQTLPLSLYWQRIKKLEKNYQLLIELVDEQDKIIFKKFYPLCYGLYPTSIWNKSDVIKTNYRFLIPKNIKSDQIRLKIALYELKSQVVKDIAGYTVFKIKEDLLDKKIELGKIK